MTVRNDADWRSEVKRRQKRAAINKHLYRGHGVRAEGTTEERMLAHAELHEGGIVIEHQDGEGAWHPQGYDHEHDDLMSWQGLEEMNNEWQAERRRSSGSSGSLNG